MKQKKTFMFKEIIRDKVGRKCPTNDLNLTFKVNSLENGYLAATSGGHTKWSFK